jgi:hypothetical protein
LWRSFANCESVRDRGVGDAISDKSATRVIRVGSSARRGVNWRSGRAPIHIAGCTPHPTAPWVTQQARQLMWSEGERPERFRFLIRYQDQKFTDSVDDVFRSEGMEIIRTPFRAPQANGVADIFSVSLRRPDTSR